MYKLQPRYSREEFARRGEEIYQRLILPRMAPQDAGKFVAIDIESEDFQLDDDDFMSTEILLQRQPDAQIWLMRVGERAAHRIG